MSHTTCFTFLASPEKQAKWASHAHSPSYMAELDPNLASSAGSAHMLSV